LRMPSSIGSLMIPIPLKFNISTRKMINPCVRYTTPS